MSKQMSKKVAILAGLILTILAACCLLLSIVPDQDLPVTLTSTPLPISTPVIVQPTSVPTVFSLPTSAPASVQPATTCCKICQKGVACGDGCISKDKVCTLPPGCACNAK